MSARMQTSLFAILIGLVATQAQASPVTVVTQDLPGHCDVLAPLPTVSDELGIAPAFPLDELIAATAIQVQLDVCTSSSQPGLPNAELRITNLTNRSFVDLHYVADPGTGFTNFDGTINGMEAVKIDNVGVNQPLLGEFGGSLALVFEPGETWQFVLDDWGNAAGFGPADLGSIGVPSTVQPDLSSGSIVAVPLIPEPATCMLLLLGTTAIGVTRSRRTGTGALCRDQN